MLSSSKKRLDDCQDNKVKNKQSIDHPDDWANFFGFTSRNFCDGKEDEACCDTVRDDLKNWNNLFVVTAIIAFLFLKV